MIVWEGHTFSAMCVFLSVQLGQTLAIGAFVDCNNNGIADSTDIANCNGNPACDDCNLNGVPDECDIDDGTSPDTDGNGVPDECGSTVPCESTPTLGPPDPCPVPVWSDPELWNLGGLYPNDLDDPPGGKAGVFATIAPVQILLLDVNVVVPALRLTPSSALFVADGDLGLSPPAAEQPGRMLIRGSVSMRDGRSIGPASGAPNPDITIDTGGIVTRTGPGAAPATLSAGNIQVIGTDCLIEPCAQNAVLDLDEMTVIASGNVTIDGSLAMGSVCGAVAGGRTPPTVRVGNQSDFSIGANLYILGGGSMIVTDGIVNLGGDFENQSLRPECFDWTAGSLLMDGDGVQFFEVGAIDVGPVTSLESAQFGMGAVTVGSGRTVTFRDVFDNDQEGQTPCSEAVYVGTLVLSGGSNITIEGPASTRSGSSSMRP